MYKNSKYTILFPLLLAAGVVLGLLLGQYMGRNSTTSQIKGMLRQMALPTNKLRSWIRIRSTFRLPRCSS